MTTLDFIGNPNLPNILFMAEISSECVAVSTFCRKHNRRGRFLIIRERLRELLNRLHIAASLRVPAVPGGHTPGDRYHPTEQQGRQEENGVRRVHDSCPYCFGTNIHPARTCDVCGKWLTGGYIKTLDGQRICDDCYTTHDIEDD